NQLGDALNGELGYVFAVSILDAAILSWIALRLYRRSVSRIMRRPAGLPNPPEPGESPSFTATAPASAGNSLRIVPFESSKVRRPATSPPPANRRRLALAYGIGAFLYSVVVTAATTASMWPTNIAAIVAQLWANSWPMLPALIALLVLDWRRSLALFGLFVAC